MSDFIDISVEQFSPFFYKSTNDFNSKAIQRFHFSCAKVKQWLQQKKCCLSLSFLYRRNFASFESFLNVLTFNWMLRNFPWLKNFKLLVPTDLSEPE